MARKCSKCQQYGHNARTCNVTVNANPEIEEKISKYVELGHKLIEKKIEEREEVNGLVPTKGFWIIQPEKQKIAGKISKVKKNGDIIYRSSMSAIITIPQKTIINEGYIYIENLEPEMLKWEIF